MGTTTDYLQVASSCRSYSSVATHTEGCISTAQAWGIPADALAVGEPHPQQLGPKEPTNGFSAPTKRRILTATKVGSWNDWLAAVAAGSSCTCVGGAGGRLRNRCLESPTQSNWLGVGSWGALCALREGHPL